MTERRAVYEVWAYKGIEQHREISRFRNAEEAYEDFNALKKFVDMRVYSKAVVIDPKGSEIAVYEPR